MYATDIGFFSERERYLVGFGFCGGLTTFSSFIVQTMQFSSSLALLNISANIGLCLVCVFLGGFTTFSTFSYESFRLLERREFHIFGANIILSLLLCGAGVAFGKWMVA